GDPKKNSHYVRNLISDIRKTLRTYHAEDIFLSGRNQFSVNPDKIDCDYYRFLARDPSVMNSYLGEYMKQYSWGEYSIKKLDEIQKHW
ncbi:MAG: response regulator, partial [Lachnoclostridium sp.]|nr:response regulator [Lachnoclostridium sp.]